MTYSKQLFVHKIGSLVQFQIKPLLIYSFVSLQVVAFYGNYALIIDKVALLIKNILGSTGAGVGNLVAEGDKVNIKKVYWELTSLNYFIAGVLVFSIYHLIEPFIVLWVGNEYVLSRPVVVILLANMFIMQTRGTNDQFLYAYSLFHDVWAPAVETVVSISVALVGGSYWGLEGVLLGSVISMFFIVVLWKPYFLYHRGFQEKLKEYWLEIVKYLWLIGGGWFVLGQTVRFIPVDPYKSYFSWILYAAILVGTLGVVLFVLFYGFSKGFRCIIARVLRRIRRR